MRVRVQGGTATGGAPPLCQSCSHSLVVRGARLGDEIVACNLHGKQREIRFAVTSCSAYVDRNHPSLWHMEEIAWVLRTDVKRKRVGFVQARSLSEDERHVL